MGRARLLCQPEVQAQFREVALVPFRRGQGSHSSQNNGEEVATVRGISCGVNPSTPEETLAVESPPVD